MLHMTLEFSYAENAEPNKFGAVQEGTGAQGEWHNRHPTTSRAQCWAALTDLVRACAQP